MKNEPGPKKETYMSFEFNFFFFFSDQSALNNDVVETKLNNSTNFSTTVKIGLQYENT